MYNDVKFNMLNSIHVSNTISESMYVDRENNLTLTQKKLISYLMSLVQDEDVEFKEVCLKVMDWLRLVGKPGSGTYRKDITDAVNDLDNKVFYVRGKRKEFHWVEFSYVDGTQIHVKLHDDLKDFLIGMTGKARTIYQFGYMTQFEFKYTPDLYLFCSRCKNMGFPYSMKIEDAIERFSCGKYKDWANLNRCVLGKAIDEINKKSDLIVNMRDIRDGRNKVTHLAFYVKKKRGLLLKNAECWKTDLHKPSTVQDRVIDAFYDDLLDEAIEIGYLDFSDLDAVSEFDVNEFIEYKKKFLTKAQLQQKKESTTYG